MGSSWLNKRFSAFPGNQPNWKHVSAVLFLLLLFTVLNCSRNPPREEERRPQEEVERTLFVPTQEQPPQQQRRLTVQEEPVLPKPRTQPSERPISVLTQPRSEEERELEDRVYLGKAYRKIRMGADGFPVYPEGFKRQLVFCISPGHTGTVWLAEVMGVATHSLAFHERAPALARFPSLLREGRDATFEARYDDKVPVVESDLARTEVPKFPAFFPPAGRNATQLFYAEISHMFIKAHVDVLMERFYGDPEYEINVVVLRRYLPDALKSWLAVPRTPWSYRTYPQHYSGGEYTTNHRNFAIMPPLKDYFDQDTVELCIGYLLDYEFQTAAFLERYPGVRVTQMRSEDLFSMGPEVEALYRRLAMVPHAPSFARLRAKLPLNPHAFSNSSTFRSDDITDDAILERVLTARILKYVSEYRAMGHWLPELPHMRPIKPCPSPEDPKRVCVYPEIEMTEEEIERYSSYDLPKNIKPPPKS